MLSSALALCFRSQISAPGLVRPHGTTHDRMEGDHLKDPLSYPLAPVH